MRSLPALFVALGLATSACGGDSDDSASDSTVPAETAPSASADVTDACSFLDPADFAVVGFTVAADGEDVSENFNLATTSSAACQWTNDDDNISSSWELVIGVGDAQAAFASDLEFAALDAVTTLDIGDEAFLADEVSSFDTADHDFEAGVRVGDVYFTMSTTDDRGSDAIVALATLVADRLTD